MTRNEQRSTETAPPSGEAASRNGNLSFFENASSNNVREGTSVDLGPGIGSVPADDLDRLVSIHGFLSTGAFIGLQMLFLGRRLLGVSPDKRIHVLCETFNCLPDPFQVLAGATVGNKGLIVRDTGKMAVTLTPHTPPGETARGVRLILDPAKTEKFEKLHAWYLNTGKFSHEEIIPILKKAGETVYSYTRVDVPVFGKQKKQVTICPVCGEPYVNTDGGGRHCADCTD